MKRYVIERNIEGAGAMTSSQLCGAARASTAATRQLGPALQWEHSYMAGDKTYCVFLAENEDVLRAHAEKSGFPADRIEEVTAVIDPTTAALEPA